MMVQNKHPFAWQNGEKRYLTLNQHLRQTFGEKIFKIPLDAGFTCPNRDGTLGREGCIYCSARGSGDFAGKAELTIHEQFETVKPMMVKKWPNAKCLAYFQAYTNTYAPLEFLRNVYEQALKEVGVVGLAIATRPDCLPVKILDYLEEINLRSYLWVEMGLQSIHDRTMHWAKRGHGYADFLMAFASLRQRNIRVCGHIILGFPGETREDMLETVRAMARLPLQGIKIHMLHILRGTPLADLYAQEPFPLLTRDEYVALVSDIIEILPPTMIIHRLTGDAPRQDLIAPLWSLKKWEILNDIDRELENRNTWQGNRFCDENLSYSRL